MATTSPNARLEAFCDGVFAIAITLLVIDIKLPGEGIRNTAEFWGALGHLGPAIFAFALSFVVILITWVNHHATLKLVGGTSAPWIYANGFLLMTVAFLPFPTALLGEFLLTSYAGPAVVLYDATLAAQAIAWILLTSAAVNGRLAADDESAALLRKERRNGGFALGVYGLFAILAIWFPLAIAIANSLTWAFWLTQSIRLRHG